LKATLSGIGVVGGFGCGVSALEQAALVGTAPPVQTFKTHTANGPVDVYGYTADTSVLEDFVPRKALRRIDHFTRLALLGSFLALDDAGQAKIRHGRMGIVFATGYGSTCDTFDSLNTDIDEDNPCTSPTRFVNSVHSATAAHIATFLGGHGPTLTINQFDMSVPLAFLTACQWIEEDRVDVALVGGADEFSRSMGYYRQYLAPERRPDRPTQLPSHRSPVGEGSAFFVLAKDRPAAVYARVKSARVQAVSGDNRTGPPVPPMIIHSGGDPEAFAGNGSEMASYEHLYGRLPVGPAFDLAMAAIMLKTGKFYPPWSRTGDNQRRGSPLSNAAAKVGHQEIGCLMTGCAGDIGWVVLSQERGQEYDSGRGAGTAG
jgi:3-oxoacyl-[acyl-carrier-protein] synthase II